MMDFARSFALLARGGYRWKILVLITCVSLSWVVPAHGRPADIPSVAVVVSRHIRPYVEAEEGFRSAMVEAMKADVQVFYLEKPERSGRGDLARRLGSEKFDLFMAVGPDAARFVWDEIRSEGVPRLYCLVLNPEKLFVPARDVHGISLNIPVQVQVNIIGTALPGLKRIGLLYDPDHNARFFREVAEQAGLFGIRVVPLEVHSKKDIPSVLRRSWKGVDAVWLIPDRTVISETIIQYVIKEAFVRKIPLIGYNRFFYESGATLAFVFDYKELGRQCAIEARKILSGEVPRNIPPIFQMWVNGRVAGKLGLKIPGNYTPPIVLGP